jgi:hypothetical protein
MTVAVVDTVGAAGVPGVGAPVSPKALLPRPLSALMTVAVVDTAGAGAVAEEEIVAAVVDM